MMLKAIKIDAASARSDCTRTFLLVLCIIGYCKSIAQRISVLLNLIEIKTNVGNKNKQQQRTRYSIYIAPMNTVWHVRGSQVCDGLKLQSMKI